MTPALRVGLALLAAGLGSAAVAEGPMPLRSPLLVAPEETAGLALAPEVAVELSIDARGLVTAVEVGSIQPSSEHDEAFRRRAVETFSRWRFAPATQDGQPVASRLQWRVRFPATPPITEDWIEATAPLAGADAEQRRAAILAMPLAQRKAMLEEEMRAALAHLDPKRMRQATSPRFVVRADADDEETAQTVANNLEAIFNILARDLLPGISLQSEPYKVQVFVYRSRAPYDAFSSGRVPLEQSAGFYSPAGLIAFHLEQPTSDGLIGTLLHEATHAFLDRHVVRPGVPLPRWLGEGFADYVGNSAIERGHLKPGKTVVHRYALGRGRVVGYDTDPGLQLDQAKLAYRRGTGLTMAQMLEASREIFYGERSALYYSSAWLLVHYLRDGAAGASADRFSKFLLYVAEGYPQAAAFRALYGAPEESESAFVRYVKEF